jgi:FtsP/CotA-like multicopper oxidase with cupredoxin domain
MGVDRRGFLRLAAGAGLGLTAGCARDGGAAGPPSPGPGSPNPGAATPAPTLALPPDLLRPGGSTGTIAAAPLSVDLGGRVVETWGYNGTLPGPEIRVRQGDVVRVRLENLLTEDTTIHWHGIELPNAMDGVPWVTQDPVRRAGAFAYEFPVPDAGSFMYHAHVGHQLDYGLYGPLVVEEKDSPGGWDREYTLMLDDWRHGLAPASAEEGPEEGDDEHGETATGTPTAGAAPSGAPDRHSGPSMGNRVYPLFLVNGRPADDPATFEVRRGERVRLRVMNIAADTGFLFAIAGHRLTVTHADGFPVDPVKVDRIRIGMGERYDVLVEATTPGAWQVAAVPEAKRGMGRAVLRYADAASPRPPGPDDLPAELTRRLLEYADLRYTGDRDFGGDREPDRVHDLVITTNRINGRRFSDAEPLPVSDGELVRVTMRNDSDLWHPMHLHGHSFRVRTAAGPGAVKDTLTVAAKGGTGAFDFLARNPGRWMFHCHNHYHMDNGMARLFTYT